MKRLWIVIALLACEAEQEVQQERLIVLPPPAMAPVTDAPPAAPETAPPAAPETMPPDDPSPGTRPFPAPFDLPAAPRVVAFGDVHGDRQAAFDVLRLVGAIDAAGHWSGGALVVVQVGDQLDRGDDERAILDWFEALADEAHAAGGAFLPLLGNHETMNVQLDFRYVTEGGWTSFDDIPGELPAALQSEFGPTERGRIAAFRPGGPYARILAGHNLFQKVGDTLFVHGGALPSHTGYGLARINLEVQRWMRGEAPEPAVIRGDQSPVWTRIFSDDELTNGQACTALRQVLESVGATRMVVAHTVQDAVTPRCDDQVWRVDVGLADYYGGPLQALEIIGDTVQIVR